ncbi:MAG: CRISPR-associated ring nuclease [Chloroflexota bacterium]
MAQLFVATLGQHPEAITVALDILKTRFQHDEPFAGVAILHTEPSISGIAPAFEALKRILHKDYRDLEIYFHELCFVDGAPLIDITDQGSATAYFNAVYSVLRHYHDTGYTLQMLVSGGRKAMSIYATLAASLIFDQRDRVWVVLSPPELISQRGVYHIPHGMQDQVHLVALPIRPQFTGHEHFRPPLPIDASQLVERDIGAEFMHILSKQERVLAELLKQHPYLTAATLAFMLFKDKRTIENQLRHIYNKMVGFVEYPVPAAHKRQVLLDILNNRS